MEVTRIEIGDHFEFLPLKQPHDRTLRFDKIPPPEFLDRPVHVNGGETTCIRKILLREGQAEAVVIQQPNHLQPGGKFAKEMRQSRKGLA